LQAFLESAFFILFYPIQALSNLRTFEFDYYPLKPPVRTFELYYPSNLFGICIIILLSYPIIQAISNIQIRLLSSQTACSNLGTSSLFGTCWTLLSYPIQALSNLRIQAFNSMHPVKRKSLSYPFRDGGTLSTETGINDPKIGSTSLPSLSTHAILSVAKGHGGMVRTRLPTHREPSYQTPWALVKYRVPKPAIHRQPCVQGCNVEAKCLVHSPQTTTTL
jgi:hypothetical protein